MDKKDLNAVELALFNSRLEAVCDEMGAVLRCAAFSPNIKDRLDFSCAIFDAGGALSAQAAHIPVHLGSMAFAMTAIVDSCTWNEGDMVIVNDPYLGGTHLPDVTLIAPVFVEQQLVAFIANRAHHANIGASSPGSMPVSQSLAEEGIVIAPSKLLIADEWQQPLLDAWQGDVDYGDLVAQVSANRVGVMRLLEVIKPLGVVRYQCALQQLNHYGEKLALLELAAIPAGIYVFNDVMDDDGAACTDIPICVRITVAASAIEVDFTGTAAQVPGNINCPLSVTAAAVFYVFRCLLPAYTPSCAGVFRPIHITAAEGCLINALRPAAVAAGNVETSTRITDVVLGALAQALPERIPAASHGSMNNVAMGASASAGAPRWDYYETIGGGMGAGAAQPGLSGVQTHMTNTLNTPVESLEMHYPVRISRYALRRQSGGPGLHKGGDGIIREFEFLAPASVTLLTERRAHQPWGIAGGDSAARGENLLNDAPVAAKCQLHMQPGDRLQVATAGGGGWGRKPPEGGLSKAR